MQANETDLFRDFVVRRLRAVVFQAERGREDSRQFYDLLASARDFFTWTFGATNGQGERFTAIPGYVEIFTPNAFADRFETRFYLGMHPALYGAIHEFSMFCFAQRSFFPEIGEAEQEKSPEPMNGVSPGLWLLDYTQKGGQVQEHHSKKLTPRCPQRYEFSVYLAFLMARFVWLHELAHAFKGHVSFVQHRNIALRLTEIADARHAVSIQEDPSDEDLEMLRALELDADQSALWASWRIQTDGRENVGGIADVARPLRLKLTLFACYAMTWLFEEFQAYMDVKADASHPPPMLRLLGLLDLASNGLSKRYDDFDGANGAACREFDAICLSIPKIFRPAALVTHLREEGRMVGAYGRLEERMQALRKTLSDYEFSGA